MAAEGGAAHLALARELARRFSALAEVQAVAAGGSVAAGAVGPGSDLDLYVFTAGEPPLAARRAIGGRAWAMAAASSWTCTTGPGRRLVQRAGVEVDVVYWDARWIGEQLERVLTHHEPSVGYSTCHWRTLRHMLPLFDRDGWLARLQARAQAAYAAGAGRRHHRRNTRCCATPSPATARRSPRRWRAATTSASTTAWRPCWPATLTCCLR